MGTEIDRRGSDTTLPLWSARALIKDPELVKQIHVDYINFGADVITTNTFRTQFWTLNRAGIGYRAKELTTLAVELAQEARNMHNKQILVAGSISPLEDCYSPKLVPGNSILTREHQKMVDWLADANVDVLLVETMNTNREALSVVNLAQDYDIPIWISMTCDENGNILGATGNSWEDLVLKLGRSAEVIMVNCSSLEGTNKAINHLKELNVTNWGAYPNFGRADPIKGWISNPNKFEDYFKSWMNLNPRVLGTCCGALPEHTNQLSKLISNIS